MKAFACLLIVAVLVLVSPTSASGCFQNCTANSDCDDAHCSLCVDGGCQFGNASSSGSADSGSSGPDTCGQPCSNGNCTGYCSHCGLDGYCRHRRNDQPQCGTGCADDSDCALAGDCTDCHGGSCSAPPSRGGSSSDGGDCPSLECDCPEDCQDGRSGSCTECSVRTARCELPRAGMITLKAVPKSVRDTGVTAARAVFGTQSRAMCNGECDCPEMCGGYCGVCDGSIGRCVPQGRAKAPVQRKLAKR